MFSFSSLFFTIRGLRIFEEGLAYPAFLYLLWTNINTKLRNFSKQKQIVDGINKNKHFL